MYRIPSKDNYKTPYKENYRNICNYYVIKFNSLDDFVTKSVHLFRPIKGPTGLLRPEG